MGRFQNTDTGVVVSVDDSKDERFTTGVSGWEAAKAESKSTSRKSSSSKADDKS